jgi:hypothetical protein
MKKYILAVISLFAINASAMGNRPPTDPADYQDIENAEAITTNETVRAESAESGIAAQQTTDEATQQADEARINKMDQTKVLAEGAVRVLDTKRFAIELFNDYDARRMQNFAMGAKVTLKLGKSYEQRLIEKQQKEIDALLQKLNTK